MKKQNKPKKVFLSENYQNSCSVVYRASEEKKNPTVIHVEAIDFKILFRDRTQLKQSGELNKSSSPPETSRTGKTMKNNCFRGLQINRDKQEIEKCLFMKIC